MTLGKTLRLKRIFSERSNRAVIVPMDHGITIGPIAGIKSVKTCIENVLAGGANGVILHKGLAGQAESFLNRNNSLIIHMSASTNMGNNLMNKVSVCSVQEAVYIGADAVSIHLNIGSESEPEQLKELARLGRECNIFGMPLLVMAYAKGQAINEYDPFKVSHAARIAAELGADIVKCNYTGSPDTFLRLVESCHIPILIAGGPRKKSIRDLFQMVYDAIKAGGAGISIGRNIFEHECPQFMTEVLVKMVHEDLQPEDALNELNRLIQEKHYRYKIDL